MTIESNGARPEPAAPFQFTSPETFITRLAQALDSTDTLPVRQAETRSASVMHVGVMVLDDVWDSGLATITDVFTAANVMRSQIDNPPPPWRVTLVSPRWHVTTAAGHRIQTVPLTSLAATPELLILPATGICPPEVVIERLQRPPVREAIVQTTAAYGAGSQVLAACSGVFFLGESGILEGKPATTSWWLGPLFRERYPQVALDTGATLISDDRVSTAGAAFAHIDLALSAVRQRSPVIADLVMRYLLIGERASQASFAVPQVVAQYHPDMCRFEQWARSHLSESPRIGDAAAALGLSERSLQRVTAAVMGMTPVEFLNEIRLDEAAHLLRTTSLSVDAVAGRVGFRNASTLRQLIQRKRGMTIRQLRRSPGTQRDAVQHDSEGSVESESH